MARLLKGARHWLSMTLLVDRPAAQCVVAGRQAGQEDSPVDFG
jgi:hypothetical protein